MPRPTLRWPVEHSSAMSASGSGLSRAEWSVARVFNALATYHAPISTDAIGHRSDDASASSFASRTCEITRLTTC